MKVEIAREYLLILIPIIAGALIYLKKYMPTRNKIKRTQIIVLRSILFSFIILALSGISINWVNTNATTIFLVDLSDSVIDYKLKAANFIKESLKELPKNNKVGIVTFGGDTKVEQFVTDKNIFTEFQTNPITTATNLESAISAAMSLITNDTSARIVLITDGNENEGNLRNMSSSLISSKVSVKLVRIENEDINNEVYISNLTIPDNINIGDTFSVNVEVESNIKTQATLYLYSGKELKATEKVEIQSGTNKFIFKDTQTSGGLKTYKAIIEPNLDNQKVNNEYTAFTNAKTSPVILLIEGTTDEGNEFEKILKASNINYIKVTAQNAPRTISQLNEYKAVVMLDVHKEDLPEGYLNNIKSYVGDFAGGLIAIGGEDSFALGEYKNTPLEEVLPVYMDLQGEKEIPEMAISLVIDHSGSMSESNGYVTNLDLAKEAAIKALDTVRPTDYIGVLAFDDSYDWVVPITKAKNKESIEDGIYGISLRGGTSIYPAIDQAYEKMLKNPAKIKHIILLTDGQDGYREYDDLIKKLNKDKITLSTVSVGSGADRITLEKLAQKGNGRYYHTDLSTDIPRIFAKEVFLSVKSYLVNQEFTPIITSNHKILKDITNEGLPSLLGYVASTKKELATQLLVSDNDDPILTVWQYGLGKTVSWNSDGDNRWTSNWAGWNKYAALWKNIVEWTFTDTTSEENFVSITQNSSKATISYTPKEYSENTKVIAKYTKENGESFETQLEPIAPGKYSSDIKLDTTGIYSISVRQLEKNETVSNQNTAFALQYSKEYRFIKNNTAITDFLTEVGGKQITTPLEVFDKDIENVKSRKYLTNLLLILSIILFMIDIAYRRLNINFEVKLSKKSKDSKPKVPKLKKEKNKKGKNNKEKSNKEADLNSENQSKIDKERNTKAQSNKQKPKKENKEKNLLNTSELLNKKNTRK